MTSIHYRGRDAQRLAERQARGARGAREAGRLHRPRRDKDEPRRGGALLCGNGGFIGPERSGRARDPGASARALLVHGGGHKARIGLSGARSWRGGAGPPGSGTEIVMPIPAGSLTATWQAPVSGSGRQLYVRRLLRLCLGSRRVRHAATPTRRLQAPLCLCSRTRATRGPRLAACWRPERRGPDGQGPGHHDAEGRDHE